MFCSCQILLWSGVGLAWFFFGWVMSGLVLLWPGSSLARVLFWPSYNLAKFCYWQVLLWRGFSGWLCSCWVLLWPESVLSKSSKRRDPLGSILFPNRKVMGQLRSINSKKAVQEVPGNNTLTANLMARSWNFSIELQTVSKIGAAKSVARKWAHNLLIPWRHLTFSPIEKKNLVIIWSYLLNHIFFGITTTDL